MRSRPNPRRCGASTPFLPLPAAAAITLGEGNTPLHDAARLGLGAVWVKDESRNPTWSFKDRLASAAVSMGRQLSATVIACSSSGNAGAAVAAYAARAGLPCINFTFRGAAGPMVTQMRAYGALVLECAHKGWTAGHCCPPGSSASAGIRTTAYFGPGGRQQSLWDRGLQDDRLRDRRASSTGRCRIGACCRSATAMRFTASGKASRSCARSAGSPARRASPPPSSPARSRSRSPRAPPCRRCASATSRPSHPRSAPTKAPCKHSRRCAHRRRRGHDRQRRTGTLAGAARARDRALCRTRLGRPVRRDRAAARGPARSRAMHAWSR
ncbi:MAG: pyridoxal-phosphate dependent enzyme [Pseudomonadota bacterium]